MMLVDKIGPPQAQALQYQVVEIYRKAWTLTHFPPITDDLRSFRERFLRHSANPDFTMSVAHVSEEPAGFAYGYTSVPGGWWRQTVSSGLPDDIAQRWFEDCFEFAELAVDPTHQHQGVGGALHDRLLKDLPHQTAMLSTQQSNRKARGFYTRRGWTILNEKFVFPQKAYPYVILGLELGARRRAAERQA
jgi:ribosomal protein S18 acetylase RimI-like enzyme